MGSAVPKCFRHGAKNVTCRADFFSACKWGFSLRDQLFRSTMLLYTSDRIGKFAELVILAKLEASK